MLNRCLELNTALRNCLPRIIKEKKNKKFNTNNKIYDDKKKKSELSKIISSEWMFIENLIQILSNLKKFTDNFQGDDAIISSVIPVSKVVLKGLLKKSRKQRNPI
jgi:hypothetical protein